MDFTTPPKLPLDDLYTHTYYIKHDPTENINTAVDWRNWSFELNKIDIGTHLRPEYTDIELVLSAVDETGQALKTNMPGDATADPAIAPIRDNFASMINSSLYSYF